MIGGSKIAGAVAGLGFCGVFAVACTRKYGALVAFLQVAFAVSICMLFEQFGYWNRPEPLLLVGVSLTLLATTLRSACASALMLGLGIALLVNLKIHSGLYVMPVVAGLLFQRRWQVLFFGFFIAAIGLIGPFVFSEVFSLENYFQSLTAAANHSLSGSLFVGNILALLFFSVPLALFGARLHDSSSSEFEPGVISVAYLSTLGVVSLVVCVIGSKTGAGSYHLIPLLPHLIWSIGHPLRDSLPKTHLRMIPAAIFTAWAVAIIFSAGDSQAIVWRGARADQGAAVVADLRNIRTLYPNTTIQVGCGGPNSYFLYFYRPKLRSQGPVEFLDAAEWMDKQLSGKTFSPATLAAFQEGRFDIWLIPKHSVPFTQTSYYPLQGGLFTDEFRSAFRSGYRLIGQSGFFDIYLARRILHLAVTSGTAPTRLPGRASADQSN